MELRSRALHLLGLTDIEEKPALTLALQARTATLEIATETVFTEPPDLPGHPARPVLVEHTALGRRSPATARGRAALIHAICHIEFNAINLALDAIWRFAGMPRAYYLDWLSVAAEEARHFSLLREHLRVHLGHDYGDFAAHQGLWSMCEKTAGDIVARMALVPRTLEARGLDATPQIQRKLRQVGTPDALAACDILELILREEIGHVAIGNHWYHWLCRRDGLQPLTHYAQLAARHGAPRAKPPLNLAARQAAGFSDEELRWLSQPSD
ncbi:ferritin-like domain-containing protein [Comamonas sp. NLF-1-9]|uniref:ferritin-like domain-containing protein n=1 Tax=Comamonas sp. NLF-1-9 TaxID=2853163 RepID=UPI001C483328|nr:ferritin-like domain-containing protein [Comamonas sp. NLF-1-9]QXL85666.1 ferritin-like domain-containing protein [Comamonas sp. NLF-1-9]